MKKYLAPVLAAVLLAAALAGCGGDKAAGDSGIVGTWRTELQLDEAINSQLAQSGMSEVVQIEGFVVPLEMEFTDEGTYMMAMDEAAFSEAMEPVKQQLRQGLRDYLEQSFSGQDISLDEALAASGTSLDQMVDEAFGEEAFGQMAQQIKAQGRYALQEGKLALSQSLDSQPDAQQSYTLDGDTLTIDAAASAGLGGLQSMVFERVSR